MEVGDAQVDKTIEELRERAATFIPVEGRAAKDGDYVLIKLNGTPEGGGEQVEADNILCHIGAEETLESFTENLRGAHAGRDETVSSELSATTIPIQKLAGKTYDYTVEVQGIKEKKLPELNDEFAKDAAGETAAFPRLPNCARKFAKISKPQKEHEQTRTGARENSRSSS